jgi:EAL domain-containing protein (putative c-di-GMP-specific phosphodiesterase class I)
MLEADELKVDKSLVVNVAESQRDRLIMKSTIDLAHSLGMEVVAEGVERADQLRPLLELDVDRVQGFHVGRPMTAERLTPRLVRS